MLTFETFLMAVEIVEIRETESTTIVLKTDKERNGTLLRTEGARLKTTEMRWPRTTEEETHD